MVEQRVMVTNRLGLHARAAAQLVRTANCFKSVLRLERIDGSAAADAKSILSVLMLAAARGTELRATFSKKDKAPPGAFARLGEALRAWLARRRPMFILAASLVVLALIAGVFVSGVIGFRLARSPHSGAQRSR